MSYPVHPNKEPPFPELSPCPWCGREKGHDLTKHVNSALGTPLEDRARDCVAKLQWFCNIDLGFCPTFDEAERIIAFVDAQRIETPKAQP